MITRRMRTNNSIWINFGEAGYPASFLFLGRFVMTAMKEKRMIESHMRSLGLNPGRDGAYRQYAEMLHRGGVVEPRALRGKVLVDGKLYSRRVAFIARHKYGVDIGEDAERVILGGE